jgi:hypothetical protein
MWSGTRSVQSGYEALSKKPSILGIEEVMAAATLGFELNSVRKLH